MTRLPDAELVELREWANRPVVVAEAVGTDDLWAPAINERKRQVMALLDEIEALRFGLSRARLALAWILNHQ